MTKEIPLTQGKVAVVDDEDFERVSQYKWCTLHTHGLWYAHKTGLGLLHRFILNAPKGMQVDHKNHDGLDCRRSNIRLCTQSQNNANCRVPRRNKSGLKGVYWNTKFQKWFAQIGTRGKKHYLGLYDDVIDAATAYNVAAAAEFGEYALLNEIPTKGGKK